MLFRRKLVMFGPREVLLTSEEPVVKQFLNGRRIGPIGMSEEKDESTMAEEQAMIDAGHHDGGVDVIEEWLHRIPEFAPASTPKVLWPSATLSLEQLDPRLGTEACS